MLAAPVPNPELVDTGTPPIPQAQAWLRAYDGARGPAINLSQAAPTDPPPPAMLDALAQAAGDPASASYGRIYGDLALAEVYAAHLSATYRTAIAADEIAITTGCNQAFFIAALAVARAGDSVILPEPWYFNHQMTLRMLGIDVQPLPCRAADHFLPDVETARRLITPSTRAIVLVTPNNPTGAIYSPAIIQAFAELAARQNIWLILDETYRDFLPQADQQPHTILATPELAARTIQLYSFSKSYAIPGHRLGALRASRSLMPHIGKILDTLQICAPRSGQQALTWAIPALSDWRELNRQALRRRLDALLQTLASNNGPAWTVSSIGAYFAYVRHPFANEAASAVARRLALSTGILALPGTYFGTGAQSDHLRFAFANADEATIATLSARLAHLVSAP